jgi:hypothetical protein
MDLNRFSGFPNAAADEKPLKRFEIATRAGDTSLKRGVNEMA